jgi:cyclophilin family peptidyl-prolyl cis-trans isomerase
MKVAGLVGWAVLGLWLGLASSAWSAEPPAAAPAPAGPKMAEFDRVFGEWKTLLGELRSMRDDYRKASPEKRPEIEQRYNELLQKGEQMQAKVTDAAGAAYREDPKSATEAGNFLLGSIFFRCQSDDYEEALRMVNMLLDAGCDEPAVHGWAAVAAFSAGQFDLADKEFKLAQKGDILSKLGGEFAKLAPQMVSELPYYKQAWQKEQAIRAAEAKADDLPRVLVKTAKGDIEFELYENEAPNTVANFISLVEKGYYKDTPFHRVLPQFMAQGGDPTGTGGGGPGYTIPDECREPNARVHFRGCLSMAKTAAPNSGGSQFFLTFRPTHHLDGQHTVFGRVVKGMEVLAKLQRRDPEKPEGPGPDKILEAKVLRKRNHPYEPKKMPKQEGE